MPWDPTGNRRNDSRVNCVKWATGYDGVSNQALHRKYASGRNQRNHKYNPAEFAMILTTIQNVYPPLILIMTNFLKNDRLLM